MRFAYELSPRQSARLIEQSRRMGIICELQPRNVDEDGFCEGRVTQIERDHLVFELTAPPPCDTESILGAYCDGQFTLNEHRYLFETSILDVVEQPPPSRLHLAPIASLMVAERRRFWRAALAESTRVELKPTTNDKPLSIQSDLLNISPDGIACRVAGSDIDALLIGEPVELSFTLSGTARACALTGVICNKTPTGSGENVIVGMQFVMRPDVPDDQVVVDLIRKTIYANQVASGREDTVH